MVEDSVRSNHRRNDSPNSIERLREIDPHFCVPRRTANSNVRVRSSLKATQTITNDEDSRAEAAERPVQNAWPGDQGADSVKDQTPDERRFVSPVSQDPIGVAERGKRVGAEVSGLEAGGASAGDVEDVLEVFVQGVEEAVGETLYSIMC